MNAIQDWINELLADGPVVLDGGWGTQFYRLGLPTGESPERWNLDHPEKVEEIARAYVQAGSRVILTNTFGGSRYMLEKHSLGDKTHEINLAAVEISKRAAGDRARVFASIGPTGKMLVMGEVTPADFEAAFSEQAKALADGGADAIVIETMSDPEEAKAAVSAAKETGLPVAACMVFDSGKNKDRTMMGTTPEQAAEILTGAGADIVGSNCGQGIVGFVDICRRIKSSTDRPVWIKSNAGLPEIEGGETVYRTTPDEFASHIPALIEAGASFVGGCCGTTPDFIRAITQTLKL